MPTFVVKRVTSAPGFLKDRIGSPLYIGADSAQHVQDLLKGWGPMILIESLSNATSSMALHNDVELPGGAMALLALALEQWGPPP